MTRAAYPSKAPDRDSLGDRMKGYEAVSRLRLVPKMPVLARLDGKAFHTFTHGMDRPIDARFQHCMWEAARYLCEQIQGCRLAYVQSDEITLLLVDYQDIKTQGWFDYEVQKMCSIAAGMASAKFHATFLLSWGGPWSSPNHPLPVFDARFWNLPAQEVTNCLIWRQQDAVRNSIQGLAQAHFSHRELHLKDQHEMQDMLHGKGVNWNDCPIPQKRGVCAVRETFELSRDALPPGTPEPDGPIIRHRWVIDEAIPIFTQDREYVEKWVRP